MTALALLFSLLAVPFHALDAWLSRPCRYANPCCNNPRCAVCVPWRKAFYP